MKLVSGIQTCLIAGAVFGMLLPQASFAETRLPQPEIKDAALQAGGMLQGSLLSVNGETQSGRDVQLLSRGEVVARTVTDSEGRFGFRGLRPGLYALQADGVASGYRVWADAAAPPSAVSEVLLVSSQSSVVRGLAPNITKPLILVGLLTAAGVIGGVIGYNVKDTAS